MNIKIALLCSIVWGYAVQCNDHTPSSAMIPEQPVYIEVSLFDDQPIQLPSAMVTPPSLSQRIRQLLSCCFKKS